MTELEGELDHIATESDSIARRIDDDATISTTLNQLEENANEASKAWSGSWLGYHSRVYYKQLQPPPPGTRFDPTEGLSERYYSNTVGDWVEYSYDEIYDTLNSAGESTLNDLIKFARTAAEEMRGLREQLLSILNAVHQDGDNKYLYRLIQDTEKVQTVSANQFIQYYRPQGKVMSRDMAAIQNGFHTPPHISLLAEVNAIRSPFGAAAKIAKIARSAKIHLGHRKGSRAFRTTQGVNIFIGHGRSGEWKDLKDFIQNRLKLPWDEFNRVPSAGITNIARLSQMLDEASIALLVMTAEDEHKDGKLHARMNVVHEAGLFQGRLGFTRAIVLLEEGCEEFSNIQGLGQIRFPTGKISAVFEEVRQILEREGLLE